MYVLKERASMKSLLIGRDGFKVYDADTEEEVIKLKQTRPYGFIRSSADLTILLDCKSDKMRAVIKRDTLGYFPTFKIYTVDKPYPEAELSKESWLSKESLDDNKLYCWGKMSVVNRFQCSEFYDLGIYYYDPETQKHPYKRLYHFKCWLPWFDTKTTIAYLADEKGGIQKKSPEDPGTAICQIDRDAFQLPDANCYGLQVAPGVDAGLMVLAMTIIDEIREVSE